MSTTKKTGLAIKVSKALSTTETKAKHLRTLHKRPVYSEGFVVSATTANVEVSWEDTYFGNDYKAFWEARNAHLERYAGILRGLGYEVRHGGSVHSGLIVSEVSA